MTGIRLRLLFAELSMFFTVQILALFVGMHLVNQGLPPVEKGTIVVGQFLVAFLIATAILLLVIKFLKGPKSLSFFFGFVLFIGTNMVFSIIVPSFWTFGGLNVLAAILAAVVIGLRFWQPNVLIHNIVLFLSLAGVSAKLGILLRPAWVVVVILIILSVYDVIAVFKTKHMVKMFKGMIGQGMPMGIVIPDSWSLLGQSMRSVGTQKLKEKKSKRAFIMLGGGDLSFPAVFAVSAFAQYGLQVAFGIIIGAMAGMVSIHFLLLKKNIRALPALPPIAAGSIIAFLIATMLV